jgi:uncharacterized protein (DUF2267 family)
MMAQDELLSHVAERAGLSGLEAAERTVRAVLGVICERLIWPSIRRIGALLRVVGWSRGAEEGR